MVADLPEENIIVRVMNYSGAQISPCVVREYIGQGGMAGVYRACQPS